MKEDRVLNTLNAQKMEMKVEIFQLSTVQKIYVRCKNDKTQYKDCAPGISEEYRWLQETATYHITVPCSAFGHL